MKCTKCGSELRQEAVFCDQCGQHIHASNGGVEVEKTIKKKLDNKKYDAGWIVIIFVIVAVIWSYTAINKEERNPYDTPYVFTPNSMTNTVNNKSTETVKPVSNLTMGQENAMNTAENYLNYSSFSRSGLIEQLEYEGFSSSDAEYAVAHCGADWNEQAAQTAKDYLEYSSFSRSGLVEQLEYEGFTSSQAEYGVNAVGY